MAETSIGTRCPECERLRARVADLETRLAAAQKHSGNSSKPPSSDIVKPPKDCRGRKSKKRRRGGQPGHPRHERPLFASEEISAVHPYTLDQCPDCGGTLRQAPAAPLVIQQVEIFDKPLRIE